jgi:MSHA biogenesis protein MshE
MIGPEARHFVFKRGVGCPRCHNTGYHGRIGIFELLQIDAPLADALRRNDSAGFARLACRQAGFRPLAMAALDYARQGITSMDEVLRVSGQVEEFDAAAGMQADHELSEVEADAAVQVSGA